MSEFVVGQVAGSQLAEVMEDLLGAQEVAQAREKLARAHERFAEPSPHPFGLPRRRGEAQ